jgi:hypothetical protein
LRYILSVLFVQIALSFVAFVALAQIVVQIPRLFELHFSLQRDIFLVALLLVA